MYTFILVCSLSNLLLNEYDDVSVPLTRTCSVYKWSKWPLILRVRDIIRKYCQLFTHDSSTFLLNSAPFKQMGRNRVPTFWKIGECQEFCFDWNVMEFCRLSGNFCSQMLFVQTAICVVVCLLALLIALFLVILLCRTCTGKQDHYDLRG